jgi:hypothetical protein
MSNPTERTDLWPDRMLTEQASEYLKEKHGLPAEPKTLRNWRALGRGPKCRYFGTLPIYDRPVLDRWAEEDALADENPVARTRRLRRAAREATA